MNKQFGIELDVTSISRDEAVRAIQAIGLRAEHDSRTDRGTHWKVLPDDYLVRNGFEIVSPILIGENGLNQVRRVVNALEAIGARVNTACDFHVHFDIGDLDVHAMRSIVARYALFETEIDAFMPLSRRRDNNADCLSMHGIASSQRLKDASTIIELTEAQEGRYFKVNLQSYSYHGTIEFRQHPGTVSAEKAINWIKFLAAFIDESARLAAEKPRSNDHLYNGIPANLVTYYRDRAVVFAA
jgi:Putative amidoligase enzyme.